VGPDGVLRNAERPRDLLGRHPGGDQAQHLALPVGEAVVRDRRLLPLAPRPEPAGGDTAREGDEEEREDHTGKIGRRLPRLSAAGAWDGSP